MKLYILRSIGVGALDPFVALGVKTSVNQSWKNSRFIERVNKRTSGVVQGEYKSLGKGILIAYTQGLEARLLTLK